MDHQHFVIDKNRPKIRSYSSEKAVTTKGDCVHCLRRNYHFYTRMTKSTLFIYEKYLEQRRTEVVVQRLCLATKGTIPPLV
jgi:hypothetical protein